MSVYAFVKLSRSLSRVEESIVYVSLFALELEKEVH